MRIAFVYDAVWPWETGGVQKRVWELARRLAPAHDVHWYGLHYWDGPEIIEREGVTLHGVDAPSELYVDGRRSIPEALSFAARLVRPLADERFDVIDCQEFPYFPAYSSKVATALRGGKLLVTWHEVWDEYWYDYLGWKGVAGRTVERQTAHVPDGHLAVSERTRTDVGGLGATAALVPNGVALDEIADAPVADTDPGVLFVGRLIAEKNAGLLVRAVDHLRSGGEDVRATIVGDGPERESIERLIQERGQENAVECLDPREEYAEVLGLMKAADALALPSEREGFGMVVLEALACGTPVVTLDHPRNAARELVTDGATGALVGKSPAALAEGIERARDCEASDCRAVARAYDWNRIAERAESIYRAVADGRFDTTSMAEWHGAGSVANEEEITR